MFIAFVCLVQWSQFNKTTCSLLSFNSNSENISSYKFDKATTGEAITIGVLITNLLRLSYECKAFECKHWRERGRERDARIVIWESSREFYACE